MAVSKKGIPHRRGIPIQISPALSEQEIDLGKGVAALGGSGSFAQGVVNLLGLEVEIPPDFKFPQGNLSWDLIRTMLVRMVSSETYFNGSELKESFEVADAWVNHALEAFKIQIDVGSFERFIDATDVAKLVFAANMVCRESVKARPDLNTKQTLQLHCSVFLVAAATLFSKGEDGYFVLGSAQQNIAAKIVKINCEGVLNSFATGSIEPELQPQQTQENTMTNANTQAQQAQQAAQQAAQAAADQAAAQAVAEQQAAADQAAAQAAQQAAEQAVQAAIDDAVKKAVAQAIAQQAAQAAAQQAAQAAPVTPAPLAPAPAQAAQAAVPQAAAGVMSMAELIARSQQQQVAHDALAAKMTASHADLQARIGATETKVAGFEARIAALEAAKTAATKTETTKVVVSGGSSSTDCLVEPTLDKAAAIAGYSLAGAGVAYLAMRLAETLMSRE